MKVSSSTTHAYRAMSGAVAFITRTDEGLSAEDLDLLCERDLSRYKRPKAILFIDASELPRSTTGKVQRHGLEARLKQG